ncbi:interferon-induced, double-stranded RNA-activated protein kinase isoform X3 [Brachyhypopomus gauderio]|uniref:interferon-induced, double-stranded RNA-activated protein kinase isoform X3 n=1 Tax=Brachyhypopomus gauderio TaxID=698409 RepID=UPI0040429CA3
MEAGQINYVASLNELSQKYGWAVEYQEVDMNGPDHIKTFTIRVVVKTSSGLRPFPGGTGRNKREAKQNAAKNAFSCLEKEQPVNSGTTYSSSGISAKLTQPNYTCWLNEYGQKTKLDFEAKETSSYLNNQCNVYACQYVCDDKEFPQALGKGKKEAKEAAAKLVYEELVKEQKTEVLDENSNGVQNRNISCLGIYTQMDLKLNTLESTTAGQNFIGMINQYCQKAKFVHEFKLVDRRGPAHNPEFGYTVVINKMVYPEGWGKTAKEAKKNAAQKAWYKINEQSLLNSQCSSQSSDHSTSPEDDSSSRTSNIDPNDHFNSSKSILKNQNTSESVIFRDSSVDRQKLTSPLGFLFTGLATIMEQQLDVLLTLFVHPHILRLHLQEMCADIQVSEQHLVDVRPKRKLAANFQMSPNRSKEETPSMNTQDIVKPSTKENSAFNQPAKSRFLEEFDSITRIGKGGFGRVFKAKRKLEDKYYAVKMVKYTSKAPREVNALASLEHTNIVRYYTAWIEDTAYGDEAPDSSSTSNSGSDVVPKFLYIQMEFCEGKTLSVWIEERNSQPNHNKTRKQEALCIMKQVLEAVKYVHFKNRIHRDLKPENIMIGHEEGVKVVDFGLVTAADADNDGGPLERTIRTGTRSYMSPEQINQSSYDSKVDIFALGLIYFELLWHFGTKTEKQKIWANIRSKDLPKAFHQMFGFEDKLIQQMLSTNPEERPDANELLSELEQITMDYSTHKQNMTC